MSFISTLLFNPISGVVEQYSRLPDTFKEKSLEMFEKYHPIEMDLSIPLEKKIPLMIEWYQSGAHGLMQQFDLKREDFALMLKENPLSFRYLSYD